jgi:predicted negative regulator of RcsB-dependent stress response
MANIDVQKKKSNPLPWIIITIVILAVVGYLIWRNMQQPAATNNTASDTTVTTRSDTTIHADTLNQ